MKFNDAAIGAVFLLGGGAIVAGAMALPAMMGQIVGPGLFPTVIGAAMVFCALPMLVRGLHGRRTELHPDAVEPSADGGAGAVRVRTNPLAVPVILGGLALYVPLLDVAGFRVLTVLYAVAVMRALGASLLGAVVFGALVTLALHHGFTHWLGVPLPSGQLPLIGG